MSVCFFVRTILVFFFGWERIDILFGEDGIRLSHSWLDPQEMENASPAPAHETWRAKHGGKACSYSIELETGLAVDTHCL